MLSENYMPALINLAQVELKLDNRSESMRLYEKILTMKGITSGQAELVKYYLSYAYLYFGRLKEGWANYDLGFGALLPTEALRSLRRFIQPRWNGEDLQGKKLLIWGEQGLGDEIMFSTCLNEVAELGGSVILECEPRLVDTFARAYPSFEVRPTLMNADRYPAINDFDVQLPIGSLPRLFRETIEDFKNFKPSLKVKTDHSNLFKNRLREHAGKLLVGICWRSGLLSAGRNLSYTALIDWQPLLKNNKIQLVNLQYGDCEAELVEVEQKLGISILRWSDLDLKNDIDQVFALIDCLDCVVSAPTAVCQMAGALGKKTFLLTRREWTLLGEKDHYPWFPSVTPLIAEKDMHLAENIPQLNALIETSFYQ